MREDARVGTVLAVLGNSSVYVFRSGSKTSIDVFPDGTIYLRETLNSSEVDVISLPVIATHR